MGVFIPLAAALAFPSPYGELHFSIASYISGGFRYPGFRPLTGNYISQFSQRLSLLALCFPVSVPLRGTTFLNYWRFTERHRFFGFRPLTGNYISQFENDTYAQGYYGFRPLTGNYISQLLGEYARLGSPWVSVPLRGTTFLNQEIDYYGWCKM